MVAIKASIDNFETGKIWFLNKLSVQDRIKYVFFLFFGFLFRFYLKCRCYDKTGEYLEQKILQV